MKSDRVETIAAVDVPRESAATAYGLRFAASVEAIKGVVVLIAGFGLLSLVHRDVQHVAESLLLHLHLNPANRYPHIFVDAITQLNNARLWALAGAAAAYAIVRLVEAFGLWRARAWAEWLAAVSGSIYIPFEIYELSRGVNALRLITFSCNALIVIFMIHALHQRLTRRSKAQAADSVTPIT